MGAQTDFAKRGLGFAWKFAYAVTIADAAYTVGYFVETFYAYTLKWGLPAEKVALLPVVFLYQWPVVFFLAFPISLGAYGFQRRRQVYSAFMFALVGAVIGAFCASEAFFTVIQWIPHGTGSPDLSTFLASSGVLSMISGAAGGWAFWSAANASPWPKHDPILPST